MDGQTDTQSRVLTMTRSFDAPVPLLFKVWTQPEHMARWWGCAGSTVESAVADLRVGGTYRVVMRLEDGAMHRVTGVYREIDAPNRLSFTWAWEDDDGDLGHETVVTVSFEAAGAKTLMHFRQAIFETAEMCMLHNQGWTASFERLDDYAPATH